LKHIARFPSVILQVKDNGHNTPFAQLPSKGERKANDWIHLVPKLRELTLSAHTISSEHLAAFNLSLSDEQLDKDQSKRVSEEDCLAANFGAFGNLTHLHLYFANLDDNDSLLLKMLMNLPKLTHLRLSRPQSAHQNRRDSGVQMLHQSDLSDAVVRLLGERENGVKMKIIIVQFGTDFDDKVMDKITQLEQTDERLQVVKKTSAKQEITSRKVDANAIANTQKHTNKKCERVGFKQFAERASGEQGVWSKKVATLWF